MALETEWDFIKMIRIILGNVGSGKTASTVRWIRSHPEKTIITNIDVKGKDFKHVIKLKPEMIILKDVKGVKKNGELMYDIKLNVDYWKKLVKKYKSINVVIDEAHIFFNPRRSMSKLNIVMNDFLALLRRVLGSSDANGELVLITQLSRRLDVIAKEMATQVQYCIHHYKVSCKKCGYTRIENNETPNKMVNCFHCGNYNLKKSCSTIEVWNFRNIEEFSRWYEYLEKLYYNHYLIHDISKIFGNYDTLQWDDLTSDL